MVVDYRGGDTATVYCSTQGTFSIPGDAARVLELDQSNVTGIVHYMGGGFGSKGGIGVEGAVGLPAVQAGRSAGENGPADGGTNF